MVPVAVPVPEAMVNAGVAVPAAGAVNLTVVASVVPKAGTPAVKLKPALTAVKLAVAATAVVGEIASAGTAAKAITTGAVTNASPPPQAAKAASKVTDSTSLHGNKLCLDNFIISRIPFKKLTKK